MIKRFLGANWWTTAWGFVTVGAGAIYAKPEIIAFLPDKAEPVISGVSFFITVIAGGVFAHGVKSKEVTGGTVQQTIAGNPARKGTQDMVDLTVKATAESGEQVPPQFIPPPN